MDTPRGFVLTLLIPVVVGGIASLLIGWHLWHGIAFTAALVTLVYATSVWIGAEPWFRLESPIIGLPILFVLGLVIGWAHFGSWNCARPITLMMQVAVLAPFFTLTLLNLFKID